MSIHSTIHIHTLSFILPAKTCFEGFTTSIHAGDRIGIIGDNGSGKSTLLALLQGTREPTAGHVDVSDDVRFGYLPQNMDLGTDKPVWEVACDLVRPTLDMLEEFADCSQNFEANQEQYAKLLDVLTAVDAFSLEARVEALLSQAGLLQYRERPVAALSGGQRMQLGLVRILAASPSILLLDEPTNHLDARNREKLNQILSGWKGTLILISHDVSLLRQQVKTLWHIQQGHIDVYQGGYDAYQEELFIKAQQFAFEKIGLEKEKRKARAALEKEQKRQASSYRARITDGDKLSRKRQKERAEGTSGRKRKEADVAKGMVEERLRAHQGIKTVTPKFSVQSSQGSKTLVHITDGKAGYGAEWVLEGLNFVLQAGERIALVGDNGSGKSTLVRAIMGDVSIQREGTWRCPSVRDIGYLDQQYSVLNAEDTVFESIKRICPDWDAPTIRRHLVRYLFRKNEEVETRVAVLSGGEKARLVLAHIAAQAPQLLILDEMTNNLDLTTRQHVIHVVNAFQGGLLVISHDQDFLDQIGVDTLYKLIR